MDLHDVSVFFDTDPVTDGYTGAPLFNIQASSFDDASSDGATNRRRVLSTGPNVVMPARRVINMYGDRWLVGIGTPDGFGGEVIRQHFNAKRATSLLALLTPGQALAAAAGTAAYAQMMYFRDTVNLLTDTEYDVQWNVFVAPGEPAGKGTFLRDSVSGQLFRVRNQYLPTEGLRLLQTDELDLDALQSCTFDTGTFDPVTEVTSVGATVANCIQVDSPKFFRFRHISDEKLQPGDTALFVPTTVPLKQGMKFTMAGEKWHVMAMQTEIDAFVAHVRRA